MESLTLIQYNNDYAQAVADMWNESEESWGGYDRVKTKDDIIDEEEISGNLSVFLAMQDEKVVGYCSFSEYKEETNVAYIPMLNVSPTYQGKKIGKALVLESIKKAIEENWSRIDLYTWAGNYQAIPLYKKCGFFWEKRDDITHLINFIPYIINTEALKKYFLNLDWYKDSIRNIEIVPDGKKEKGFEFFEYMWKKGDTNLRVELCKHGRGLRLIETDDYKISVIVEDRELVTDNDYKILYHIVNKSGKSLTIDIKGFNDKNIYFNFKKSIKVKKEEFIYGQFYLDNIEEEPGPFEPHPCISSRIKINGEEAIFRLGITPRKPIKLDLVIPNEKAQIGVESKVYLDIENRLNENVKLKIVTVELDNISFTSKNIVIDLKAKENASIEVGYTLKNYHYFSENIRYELIIGGKTLGSSINLRAIFKGDYGIFYGETKKAWVIVNREYSVELQKNNNEIIIDNLEKVPLERFRMLNARLGMPLSSEFSKKKPKKVEYTIEGETISLKALYESKDFQGVEIQSVIKLYSNGLVENYYNIFNRGSQKVKNNMHLSQSFIFNIGNSYIPFKNTIVELTGDYGSNLDYWDAKNISENWLFSKSKNATYGISWPEECRVKFNEWYMSIDTNLGEFKPGTCVTTKPIVVAYEVYSNWQEFRKSIIKNTQIKDLKPKEHIDLSINEGNPFVKDEFKISIVDYKSSTFNGRLYLESHKKAFQPIEKHYKSHCDVREDSFNIKLNSNNLIDIIKLNLDFEAMCINRKKVIFKVGNSEVEKRILKENGMDMYIVDNGIITMKACPQFSNSLYSIKYNNNEWLDSDFPKRSTRSWWSPWTGGIICSPGEPNQLQNTDIFEGIDEERSVEFVEILDNHHNKWSGIKLNITIKENEKYKGLEINQYFLTMPQTSMIWYTAEIIQNKGKYIDEQDFVTTMFIKSDNSLKDSYFVSKNKYGEEVKYKAGAVQMCIYDSELMIYGGNNRKDKLHIYSPEALSVDGYLDVKASGCFIRNRISLANNERYVMPPTFMIFNDEYIDKELLESLDFKLDIC